MIHYTSTRLPLPDVRRLVRDLPGVLCGRIPDKYGLRQTFVAAFAHELYRLGYDSFRVRSTGAVIADFDPWKPLDPRTIKSKNRPKVRSTLYDRPETINVRTGRLMASFAPGTITPAGYLPVNSDQRVVLRPRSIELTTLVKYAARALRLRPVWPTNMRPLIRKATQAGAEAVTARLQRMLNVS